MIYLLGAIALMVFLSQIEPILVNGWKLFLIMVPITWGLAIFGFFVASLVNFIYIHYILLSYRGDELIPHRGDVKYSIIMFAVYLALSYGVYYLRYPADRLAKFLLADE